jgi:hypothetical protein
MRAGPRHTHSHIIPPTTLGCVPSAAPIFSNQKEGRRPTRRSRWESCASRSVATRPAFVPSLTTARPPLTPASTARPLPSHRLRRKVLRLAPSQPTPQPRSILLASIFISLSHCRTSPVTPPLVPFLSTASGSLRPRPICLLSLYPPSYTLPSAYLYFPAPPHPQTNASPRPPASLRTPPRPVSPPNPRSALLQPPRTDPARSLRQSAPHPNSGQSLLPQKPADKMAGSEGMNVGPSHPLPRAIPHPSLAPSLRHPSPSHCRTSRSRPHSAPISLCHIPPTPTLPVLLIVIPLAAILFAVGKRHQTCPHPPRPPSRTRTTPPTPTRIPPHPILPRQFFQYHAPLSLASSIRRPTPAPTPALFLLSTFAQFLPHPPPPRPASGARRGGNGRRGRAAGSRHALAPRASTNRPPLMPPSPTQPTATPESPPSMITAPVTAAPARSWPQSSPMSSESTTSTSSVLCFITVLALVHVATGILVIPCSPPHPKPPPPQSPT